MVANELDSFQMNVIGHIDFYSSTMATHGIVGNDTVPDGYCISPVETDSAGITLDSTLLYDDFGYFWRTLNNPDAADKTVLIRFRNPNIAYSRIGLLAVDSTCINIDPTAAANPEALDQCIVRFSRSKADPACLVLTV